MLDGSTLNPIHLFLLALQFVVLLRVLLRPHREPESRIAWALVVLVVPILGAMAYLLLGEVNIGHLRLRRRRQFQHQLPRLPAGSVTLASQANGLFRLGQSIGGFTPEPGNRAVLATDSNDAITRLAADIDAAKRHVHLSFYIWLDDRSGTRIAEALIRAARRGVACRVLVDGLGSRMLLKSPLWQSMQAAGVSVAVALSMKLPLMLALLRRFDLRNHRKIAVIDNHITYCGSQNCADPEFRIKAKYAPWVDILARFEGPVVLQNQRLFAVDWMAAGGDDLSSVLLEPAPFHENGFIAQVIGTGPDAHARAMSELFASLLHAAQHELVISTPYFVPDQSLLTALCSCARRGVHTTLVLPARNDSIAVGAASRSLYSALLSAGVRIHEFNGGLLHAKTLTVDRSVCLIGSANMDRRSFDLNFENNILVSDQAFTEAVRERQSRWLAQSKFITHEDLACWSLIRRLWHNLLGLLGPLL